MRSSGAVNATRYSRSTSERSDTSNVLSKLRDLAPNAALNIGDAYTLAERQADLLLMELGITGPAVDIFRIASLPNIAVEVEPRHRMPNLAGFSTLRDGHWLIVVNATDAPGRRRFTLAHEFKHIIDDEQAAMLYERLGNSDAKARARQVEQICDYFSACVLMPRKWLVRAWMNGIQDPEALAGLFGVSMTAISVRLRYLGLDHDSDRAIETYFRRHTWTDAFRRKVLRDWPALI